MLRAAMVVSFFTLAVSRSTLAEEPKEQPVKLLDYYGMSLFPHLISSDFSFVQRFNACFEVDGHVIVATKLWPIGKHLIFAKNRQGGPLSKGGDGPILSARYDRRHIWVTFTEGEMAEMNITHSRDNFFHQERCRTANQSSN